MVFTIPLVMITIIYAINRKGISFIKWKPALFSYKNIAFPAPPKYSSFAADFSLKIVNILGLYSV